MTCVKEKPKVHGGKRLRAQISPRSGLPCTAVLPFTPLVAAANFDPELGTIRGKVTLVATGLPLHQVHRLFL